MDKGIIIERLQAFIQKKREEKLSKKTEQWLTALGAITEEDVSLGEQPRYFFANMTCNSTGVGKSTYQGGETQRTVARDYVTDTYLFVDGDQETGKMGLSLYHFKKGERFYCYKKSDMKTLANMYGFELHKQYFSDLNFSFTIADHRVNRYVTNIVQDPFTYPIRPIYTKIPNKEEKYRIGYAYTMQDKEYIWIDPDAPNKLTGKLPFSPWWLLGLLCPPILIIGLVVWLLKE